MKKLKDRILLGLVSGLVGGVVKNIAGEALVKRGYSEYSGPQRAAGILVPAHKITTTGGKIIGWLAEASISGLLGIATVYTLSLTGKDKALLKGIFLTGGTAWTALYGAMGTVGATRVQSPMPKTVISESITHGLYGAATADGGLAHPPGDRPGLSPQNWRAHRLCHRHQPFGHAWVQPVQFPEL